MFLKGSNDPNSIFYADLKVKHCQNTFPNLNYHERFSEEWNKCMYVHHLMENLSCSQARVSSARLIFLWTIWGGGRSGYNLEATERRFSKKRAPADPSLGGLETCRFKDLKRLKSLNCRIKI